MGEDGHATGVHGLVVDFGGLVEDLAGLECVPFVGEDFVIEEFDSSSFRHFSPISGM